MKSLIVSVVVVWMFSMLGCASNAIFPDSPQEGQTDWMQSNAVEAGVTGISTIPNLEYSLRGGNC